MVAKIAQRLSGIEPFRVVEVLKRARELQALGREILHMEAGKPDFTTARPIVEAGRRALEAGATHYSEAAGIPELRQAIAEFYQQHRGLHISPERILVTPGASGALLIDPGTLEILEQRRDIFAERRNFLLPELRRLGFVIPNTPAGAFYLYADASRFTNDSRQFCLDLLEQHGVALTRGADFGNYRANEHICFSFTTGMPQLERAVERLEKVLAAGG